MDNVVKPPFGIKPRLFVVEDRIGDIREGIKRFVLAGKDIPNEWIHELSDLIRLKNELDFKNEINKL